MKFKLIPINSTPNTIEVKCRISHQGKGSYRVAYSAPQGYRIKDVRDETVKKNGGDLRDIDSISAGTHYDLKSINEFKKYHKLGAGINLAAKPVFEAGVNLNYKNTHDQSDSFDRSGKANVDMKIIEVYGRKRHFPDNLNSKKRSHIHGQLVFVLEKALPTSGVTEGDQSSAKHTVIRGNHIKVQGDYVGGNKSETHHHYHSTVDNRQLKQTLEEIINKFKDDRKTSETEKEFHLPGRNPNFVGREDVLAHMRSQLLYDSKPVVIHATSGLGGIGKTQLAIEYAHRFSESYSHIIWIDSSSSLTFTQGVIEFAKRVKVDLDGLSDNGRMDRIKSWFHANPNWLLILDNAEDQNMIDPYLPNKGGHVLITSLASDWAEITRYVLELDILAEAEACELLRHLTGITDSDKELQELANTLGRLPLALAMAGNYIRKKRRTVQDYLHLYRMKRQEYLADRNVIPLKYQDTVYSTWKVSMESIESESPEALDALSFSAFMASERIPEEVLIAKNILKKKADVDSKLDRVTIVAEIGDMVETLLDYSMIKYHRHDKTFSVHQLVQDVIRDELSQSRHQKLLEEALLVIKELSFQFLGENWAFYTQLSPHGIRVAEHAVAANTRIEDVACIQSTIANHQVRIGNISLAETLYLSSISHLQTVHQTDQHRDISTDYGNLGCLYHMSGKLDKAHAMFQKGLSIDEKLGTKPNMANYYCNMGVVLHEQGKLKEAFTAFEKSLAIEEELGRKDYKTNVYTNIGELHRTQGNLNDALAMYNQALTLYEEMDSKSGLCRIYKLIGNIHQVRGELDQSLAMYEKSLAICTELGDKKGMASIYNDFGVVYAIKGLFEKALEFYQKSTDIYEELGLITTTPNLHSNIGGIYLHQGRITEALARYEKALTICLQLDQKIDAAVQYGHLGIIFLSQGQKDKAKNMHESALAIFEELEVKDKMAIQYKCLGDVYRMQDDFHGSMALYKKALHLFKELKLKDRIASTYSDIGDIHMLLDQFDESIAMHENSLALKKEIFGTEDHIEVARTYFKFGLVYVLKEDMAAARVMLEKSKTIYSHFLPSDHHSCLEVDNMLDHLNNL